MSVESKFLRHMMRSMGNAAEYFMFFSNGKLRFWSLYVFFIENFWVKNKDLILFTNNFDLFA